MRWSDLKRLGLAELFEHRRVYRSWSKAVRGKILGGINAIYFGSQGAPFV